MRVGCSPEKFGLTRELLEVFPAYLLSVRPRSGLFSPNHWAEFKTQYRRRQWSFSTGPQALFVRLRVVGCVFGVANYPWFGR